MNPTWNTFKRERDHLTKRIKSADKTVSNLMDKKHKYESKLWFIKSMVESAISNPETSFGVIGKISDSIEELNMKTGAKNENG